MTTTSLPPTTEPTRTVEPTRHADRTPLTERLALARARRAERRTAARARRAEARDRIAARLRVDGPWLLRDAIRALLTITLAAVSAVYLTRWALLNHYPTALAWSVPLAVDAAALLAIVVHTHPRDTAARKASLRLAWGAGGLSVAGNGAMHAHDFGLLQPSVWTVIATGAIIPLMLVWSYHVASGMAPRPSDRGRTRTRTARPASTVSAPSAPAAPRQVAEGAVRVVSGASARPGDDAPTRPAPVVAAGDSHAAMVRWALDNRQTSGQYAGKPAGKKAIAKAFPNATERQALNAMTEARRRAETEEDDPAPGPVPLHVVGGDE